MINATQVNEPISKAEAALSIFKGCSRAMAKYPRTKMTTIKINMFDNLIFMPANVAKDAVGLNF